MAEACGEINWQEEHEASLTLPQEVTGLPAQSISSPTQACC